MSSQPSDHPSWRLQEGSPAQNISIPRYRSNLNPPTNPSPTQNATPAPMFPRIQPPPGPTPANPQPTTSRKRQFRFSVRADIELLRLVLAENPYGAAHGGRLHKWQSIAETLRTSGIDIDFRRARDRTGLLLEQWRDRDLPLLRRCGSGNQEDQAEKENLLDRISEMEKAARPRESDWRSRDQQRSRNHQGSPAGQLSGPHQDNPSDPQAKLNVMAAGGDPMTNKHNNFTSAPSPHLPPIVQKRDHHAMTQGRTETESQGIQYGGHGSSEKHFKNNQGRATLSPPFSQPLFGNPPSPSKVINMQSQNVDRRSPPRGDLSPYSTRLPILRQPDRVPRTQGNPHGISVSAVEISPIHPVANSPRVREMPTNMLDRTHDGAPRNETLKKDNLHLLDRVACVERRLDELCALSAKRLEVEQRRFQWEQECETRRRQVEEERRGQEIEEKKIEREGRRLKDSKDQENHRQLLDLIMRSHAQNTGEGVTEEQ